MPPAGPVVKIFLKNQRIARQTVSKLNLERITIENASEKLDKFIMKMQ